MFFTPFAFVQQPYAVSVVIPYTYTGYYLGGSFTTYRDNNRPYIRMLDSSGSISSSYNTGAGFTGGPNSLVTQSDGKIVLTGNFTNYSGSASPRIIRLNTDGTKDTTFNPGTGPASAPNAIAIQSDGKFLLGGGFTTYSGSTANRVTRINTNGSRDGTFNAGTGPNSTVNDIVIQSDGKVLIAGSFTSYTTSGSVRIARINTDGTIDSGSSWNTGTGFANVVQSMALQSDQKVVVGGYFQTYSGSAVNYIARVNTNGTLDTTFKVGAGFNTIVNTVAIQSDGKILAGGDFTTYSGSVVNYIARINTDGTRDTTFNTGTGFDGSIRTIYVQPDQKIVVTGLFGSYSGSVRNGVIRLNSDGTRDVTFNSNLSINTAAVGKVVTQLSNGSVLLTGTFTGDRAAYINALSLSGSTTPQSSASLYGMNGSVNTISLQSDGKTLVGGVFTGYSGSVANRLLRLNTNSTIDSTFNTGTGFNSTVNATAIQPDGKILVGGLFTTYSGSSSIIRIARLNTDGTRDTTFNPGTTGASGNVQVILPQPDQKIILAGGFPQYSGSASSRIVRANADGTRDTTFNVGAGFGNDVNSAALQSDGKIVVVGFFTTYSGSTQNYIVRLNTDGTADTGSSWNQGAGLNTLTYTTAIQPDGKILVGGAFTTYSGSGATRIARINTDGTIDSGSSWNTGTGFNSTVQFIQMEPGTNKIMVGGDFTVYSGSTTPYLVRLNTDGTKDTTFAPTASGFNSTVTKIIPY